VAREVCDGGWWAACSYGDGLVMTAMVLRRKMCAKTLVGPRKSRCDGRWSSALHNL